MIKKISVIFVVLIVIIAMCENVYATELQTKLDIVQKASETKYLENDQGYISKTIVDSNADTGEVTIELKLSNAKKESQTEATTEIMLVIDNSPSMDFVTTTGKTRKELVIESTKKLVNSIFKNSTNANIGIVDFHGDDGWWISNVGIQNATLRQKPINDKDLILSKLDELNKDSTVAGTNIDAGLQRAEKSFSSSCKNKVIILLTDGVPNADVTGNNADNDTTTEIALKVQATTKETLQRLDKEGINIISMMTGMSKEDGNTDKEGNVYEDSNVEDELKAVERIFGTTSNPTVGKYYLVKSVNVDNIISNDILKDVMEKIQNPINTVKVVDYFPEDITENFDFTYVGKPSLGTVSSDGIDKKTNTITWDIGTLKGEETATLKYKLKIKDMKNKDLLNKTIATNDKVVLTYKDVNSKNYNVTLSSSPKIQLSEVKEDENKEQNQNKDGNSKNDGQDRDTTKANSKLPQTGESIVYIVSIGVIVIAITFVTLKLKRMKDVK